MTLTITERLIRSPVTGHTAELTTASTEGSWRVTWLPGWAVSRAQAIAAMELAEAAATADDDCDPEVYDPGFWSRADELAAQLGLSGPDAIARAMAPPGGPP